MRKLLRSPVHVFSLACLVLWAVFASIQLGTVPFARYAWGFNFWQYLPDWAAPLLAAASLALCSGAVRGRVAWAAERLRNATVSIAGRGSELLVILTISLALWLMREQLHFGDAQIHLLSAITGSQFMVPEIGATFLLIGGMRIAHALSLSAHTGISLIVQGFICACGGLTILCVLHAARYLTPGRSVSAVLLILSGGMIRIFAGHVEVYPFLFVGLAAYLWAALAFLNGRCSWVLPSLALGIAVWLHLSALFLVPSLILLPRIASPALPARKATRQGLLWLALASLPSLLFLLTFFLLGAHADLAEAWERALAILGLSEDPEAIDRWVRGWGGPPSIGTDYVFLSWAHLKYLINAAFVLAPSAVPLVAVFAFRRPRRLLATPNARFLSAACLPLVAYALVLNPAWGPFDWDLFAITLFFLAALGAHLLAQETTPATHRQVVTGLVGLTVLFVTIPWLTMGSVPAEEAGPFVRGTFAIELMRRGEEPPENLKPWL